MENNMKTLSKYLLVLLIGWTAHMLYLDAILVRQHQIIDKCDMKEKPEKDGTLPCLRYGNDTASRYYGKYFGIYALVQWNTIVTGQWRME